LNPYKIAANLCHIWGKPKVPLPRFRESLQHLLQVPECREISEHSSATARILGQKWHHDKQNGGRRNMGERRSSKSTKVIQKRMKEMISLSSLTGYALIYDYT
jgi:hypothetical protein